MGLPVLILGESGTGKSASLRNFPNDAVAVINVANKPLPFKNKIASFSTDDYMKVEKHVKQLSKDGKKSIVIDDAQYLMANEFMRRATERGYDKFTDIAKNFWSLVKMVEELPDDVIVYFLAHIERDPNGNEKIKTIGKLLDEKITVEGMFTIVLKTNVTDGQYYFLTQNNGHDTVKSPIGMFPTYAIDNDLYYVDNKIRNYYEMGLYLTDEEVEKLDEIKANHDVQKDTGEKKSRRKKEEAEEPKRKRRAATDSDVSGADAADDSDPAGDSEGAEDKPKRRRRVGETMAEERQEVEKENASMIAGAGLDQAEGEEGVPFDEVETPEVKPAPRRRKNRDEQKQEASKQEAAPEAAEETEKHDDASDPEADADPTPRRRRRRA